MTYQIDQSGKIEDTSKDTVLALSNDIVFSLLIPRYVKRRLQKIFRNSGQPRIFVLVVFSAGLSLLLKKSNPKKRVIIDREYYGKEGDIKKYLNEMLSNAKNTPPFAFQRIGKASRAHFLAKTTAQGKNKPNFKATLEDLIAEVGKTEVSKTTKGRLSQG